MTGRDKMSRGRNIIIAVIVIIAVAVAAVFLGKGIQKGTAARKGAEITTEKGDVTGENTSDGEDNTKKDNGDNIDSTGSDNGDVTKNNSSGNEYVEPKGNYDAAEVRMYPAENGINVSDLFSYTGNYVEDGSNALVEGVAAVRVVNASDTDIQYLEVTVKTEKDEYLFNISTLFPGESVIALEKSKQHFNKEETVESVSVQNCASFLVPPSLYEDTFRISVMDSVVNIENISDENIDGPIYLYYKNMENGEYLGGITYRVMFDTLKAGEIKQMSASHLHTASSRVLFVTYPIN